MSNINLKMDALVLAMNDLRSLKESCDSAKSNPPAAVGGGKTVNELEEIGNLYKSMNEHFSQMVSSTISFLQRTKSSFQSSDEKAAAEIKN